MLHQRQDPKWHFTIIHCRPFPSHVSGLLRWDRRLAARRALPYSQRLLVEDDEARLRKVLAVEAKKGDPAGKVARGLARLQVHASVADPNLLAAAQKCVTTAARREGLAAEAARLEKKGELREALQQCVFATI